MFLAVQYYRPPFPERPHWQDDLSQIRDAGLHGIQLWCIWGWVEPEPGTFRFDDYDEIISAADGRGLEVVLSTVAEIHPFWIHREVPGCALVDCFDRPVVSCARNEVNVGLSPGGCFDHPIVADRMETFLEQVASRYAGAGNLFGWDCWNETRWNVHAEGITCYCEHTLAAFRAWLRQRYGDLAGLGRAWKRRVCPLGGCAPEQAHRRTVQRHGRLLPLPVRPNHRTRTVALRRHPPPRRGPPDHRARPHAVRPLPAGDRRSAPLPRERLGTGRRARRRRHVALPHLAGHRRRYPRHAPAGHRVGRARQTGLDQRDSGQFLDSRIRAAAGHPGHRQGAAAPGSARRSRAGTRR